MHTDTVTTTVPSQRTGGDRRKGPRRAEEAAVHYAILNIVAAAEAYVDSFETATWPADSEPPHVLAGEGIEQAVDIYRRAVAELGQ